MKKPIDEIRKLLKKVIEGTTEELENDDVLDLFSVGWFELSIPPEKNKNKTDDDILDMGYESVLIFLEDQHDLDLSQVEVVIEDDSAFTAWNTDTVKNGFSKEDSFDRFIEVYLNILRESKNKEFYQISEKILTTLDSLSLEDVSNEVKLSISIAVIDNFNCHFVMVNIENEYFLFFCWWLTDFLDDLTILH